MNIKNIKNLFKAYFIENWKTDLFQFGILAALVLLGTIQNGSGNMHFSILCMFIFLMFYPERLFRSLHGNSSKIHYLSIPASNGEKVLTNMLLANIYYVVGLVVACAIGLGLSHLYLIARGYQGVMLNTGSFPTGSGILLIYAILAVFFFGSVYFRKRTTLSTIGVGMLIGLGFLFLIFMVVWVNGLILIPKDASFHDFIWNFSSESMSDRTVEIMAHVCMGVAIVYFYALSFLRLRETEA